MAEASDIGGYRVGTRTVFMLRDGASAPPHHRSLGGGAGTFARGVCAGLLGRVTGRARWGLTLAHAGRGWSTLAMICWSRLIWAGKATTMSNGPHFSATTIV